MQQIDKDSANILITKAKAAADERLFQEAERHYREALTALEKTFGDRDRRLIVALQPLLDLFLSQGDEAAAAGIREHLKRLG